MEKTLTRYDTTGRITSTVTASGPSFEANKTGLWVEGRGNHLTDYVKDGAITPRPECPTTLAGDMLTNLPNPCTITINGTAYPCTDDHAELSFDQPGAYKIVVQAWPYLDKEFVYENPT